MPRTLDSVAKTALGANLVEARNKRGWNQGQAAGKAGVSRSRLNLWENGKETPGAEGLIRLAVTYDCPVDDLLGGVDEEYDDIIERRIPIDAHRFDRAKLRKLQALTMRAMQLTVEATETRAPTPEAPSASAPLATRDKSKPTRARQKPKG